MNNPVSIKEENILLLWLRKHISDLKTLISGGGGPDMTNYYTKSEVDAIVGNIETLLSEI